MERTDILALMGELKLYGMRAGYDEVMATGIKRQHEPPRIVGDLLMAQIAEKQARSIKYQMTIAKLPLAKDLDGFAFDGTPINEALVRDLSNGGFLAEQRNAVLIGGTGTGKSHLAIAIARACIRGGSRGRFYNVVDLVNRLDGEARAGRQGRMADYLSRLDFVILDELGYLPFAQAGGQLLQASTDCVSRQPVPAYTWRLIRSTAQELIAVASVAHRLPPFAQASALKSFAFHAALWTPPLFFMSMMLVWLEFRLKG